MKRSTKAVLVASIQLASFSVFAFDLKVSARTDSSEQPFIAYGYNPVSKIMTGHLIALRTAPGRTDECKLVFAGNAAKPHGMAVEVLPSERPADAPRKTPDASVVIENGDAYLKLSRRSLDGECDWVLPFNVGPRVIETTDSILVAMKAPNEGSWIAVHVIGAKKAQFHDQPSSTSVRKAFLVAGDMVYVYREHLNWYFVEYEGEKKKTVGWIRKSDVVEP